MKLPYQVKDLRTIQKNLDYIATGLGFQRDVRGEASVNGAGTPVVDLTVTDRLPAAGKKAVVSWNAARSVFTADFILISILTISDNTTVFRLSTKAGGNITAGQAVVINYIIWR